MYSGFECTSSEVLNSVFDDLGRSIDEEQGLKKLTIMRFNDKNTLHEWPLGQLVVKSPRLEYLKIYDLIMTTPANRSQFLEFAGLAATNSSCLHTLFIGSTYSSAEDGDKLMQVLADDHMDWLEHITFWHEERWFENRDGCMTPLLVLLARQTSLKTLTMEDNLLSDSQKAQIRQVVTQSAPACQIDFGFF